MVGEWAQRTLVTSEILRTDENHPQDETGRGRRPRSLLLSRVLPRGGARVS